MITRVTETKIGNQPNPAKDGSNSSNTSESSDSSQAGSQDGIFEQQKATEKPQDIGGNLAPPPYPSTAKEPGERTTELQPISEPTTGKATVSVKIDDPENQTETETAATIGTVDPDRDAQNSETPINPSGPPSWYKQAAVVAFAAFVAGVTTTLAGLVAQYLERLIRGGEELNSTFLKTKYKTELEIVLAEILINCMRVISLFIVDYVTENKEGLTANESIERCLKKIDKITCKMPKMLRDSINDALLQLVVGAFGLGAVWAMEQKTPADTDFVLGTIFHPGMSAGINTIRNYVWPKNSEQTKCDANLSDGFKVGGRAVSRGVQAAILASGSNEGLNAATPIVFGSVSVIKETLIAFCIRLAKKMLGNTDNDRANRDSEIGNRPGTPGSSNDHVQVQAQNMGRPIISGETALTTPVLDGLLTPGVSAPAKAPAKTPAKTPEAPDKAKPNNILPR